MKRQTVAAYMASRGAEMLRELEVDAKWLREQLLELYHRCMQQQPVLDKNGKPTGQYTFDAKNALGALKALAEDCAEWGEGRQEGRPLPIMVVFRGLQEAR